MLNIGPNLKSHIWNLSVWREFSPETEEQESERNILEETKVKQQVIHDVIMQVIQKLKICIYIKVKINYIKQ